jgi:flagellar motor switch protein FliN/FliY
MATTQAIPNPAMNNPSFPEGFNPEELGAEMALVRAGGELQEAPAMQLAPPMARLPVELDVSVPVRDFRVRNLLALEAGQIIETEWGHGDDVPLAAGDVQLTWAEFEVVETQLAVRITRLS